MKKIISILFSMGLVYSLSAQEVVNQTEVSAQTAGQTTTLVSKKGINILPEKGEWSLGIDATPFLNYVGTIINPTAVSAPSMSSPNSTYAGGVFFKYMLTDKSALRLSLSATVNNLSSKYSVLESSLTPDVLSPQYVEDIRIENVENIYARAGIEKRRGKSRVQGYYGADFILGVEANKTKYEYGNDINVDFNVPAYNTGVNNGVSYGSNGERPVQASVTNRFIVGAVGFIGAEFFFGPKISLGGELGYSVRYRSEGNTQTTYEYWNTTELRVSEYTTNAQYKGYNSIGLFTQASGTLKLSLYF